MKARDCRSDRFIQGLDNGLQMRHLAPEPIVDVGVVRRWLWRLSPCVSVDFFRRRACSSDERRPHERDESLWEAVGELPARQRSAVVLRYLADMRHREIAQAIGCSEEAARRSLHEGLAKLRKVVVV